MSLLRLFTATVLLGGTTAAFAATDRASLAVDWTENLSRSSSPLDWQDVLTFRATATRSWTRQLTPNLTTVTEAEGAARVSPEYDRLTTGELTVRGELRRKFGLGPFAPVLSGTAALTGRAGNLSSDNGVTRHIALQAGKRLNASWRLNATAEAWRHHAAADTFDISYRRHFAEAVWDVTDRWQVSSGYGRLKGSFTANASAFIWNRALTGLLGPAIEQYYNANPWETTDSFAPGWVTYKVHGAARYWWWQVSPALSDSTTLSLRHENTLTKNLVHVKYRQVSWTAAVVHRF